MTNTPVGYLSGSRFSRQNGETSGQDIIHAHLYWWVSTCLDRSEQHLDTMAVTAPYHLKLAFGCYDAMADEIEHGSTDLDRHCDKAAAWGTSG